MKMYSNILTTSAILDSSIVYKLQQIMSYGTVNIKFNGIPLLL